MRQAYHVYIIIMYSASWSYSKWLQICQNNKKLANEFIELFKKQTIDIQNIKTNKTSITISMSCTPLSMFNENDYDYFFPKEMNDSKKKISHKYSKSFNQPPSKIKINKL